MTKWYNAERVIPQIVQQSPKQQSPKQSAPIIPQIVQQSPKQQPPIIYSDTDSQDSQNSDDEKDYELVKTKTEGYETMYYYS